MMMSPAPAGVAPPRPVADVEARLTSARTAHLANRSQALAPRDGLLQGLAVAIAAAAAFACRLAPIATPGELLSTLSMAAASIFLAIAVLARGLRAGTAWTLPAAVLAILGAVVRGVLELAGPSAATATLLEQPPKSASSAWIAWALGCVLLATLLALRPNHPRALRLACWCAIAMTLGAAVAVVVATLGVEYVYSPLLFSDTGVELPLLTLSIALAQWRAAVRLAGDGATGAPVEDRIVRSAALVLGFALCVTAAVAFVEMRQQIERDKGDLLAAELMHEVNTLATEVKAAREGAASSAGKPALLAAMAALHRADEGSEGKVAARIALQKLAAGFTESSPGAFTLLDSAGHEVAAAGNATAAPRVVVNLPLPGVQLLWSDGYVVRTSAAVQVDGHVVGHMIAERRVHDRQPALGAVNGLGATGEIEVCSRQGEQVVCFPSRFGTSGQSRPLATPARLPADRAVTGEREPVWELDHRGRHVLAALLPAPELNLGLVAKRDADEVLRPVRRLVEWGLPLLAMVVAAAYWLLARHLKPMAHAVVKAKRDAQRHAAKWSALNEAALDGFMMLRPLKNSTGQVVDWNISDLNPAAEHLLRLQRQGVHSLPLSALLGSGSVDELIRLCTAVLADNTPATFESEILRKGSPRQWLHYNVVPFRGGIALTIKDLTLRRNAEQAARDNERRLQTITDQMPAMIAVVDTGHVFRFNNLVCEQWFSRPLASITGRPVSEVLGAQAHAAGVQAMKDAASTRRLVTVEDGSQGYGPYAAVEITYIPQFDEHSVLTGFCLLGRDVTASKLREHRLVQAAQQDTLTGLPNRAAFDLRLIHSLQQMNDCGKRFSVAYVDLDHFKKVNDTYGHAAGDELLKAFGQRVVGVLRRNDMVARLGGDEFALVLEELDDPAHGEHVARHLYAAFAAPVIWGEVPLTISASMGLTLAVPGDRPSALLKRADAALYDAKARGRNNCVVA